MSRYESKSEAFGQGILKDQRQRADKIAKEQESFAKKIAGAQMFAKGVTSYLDDRMERFNNSLADEKAYLATIQGQAKNILNQQTALEKSGLTVEEYMEEKLLSNFQSQAERKVKGVMVQVAKDDGSIIEVPSYDIPKATLRKSKFIIGRGEGKDDADAPGTRREIDFETLVNEQSNAFRKLVVQARTVPTDAKDIENYLKTYANQEMPQNMFSFVTRGLRNVLSGENADSLKDKINRTTATVLSDNIFSPFKNFSDTFNGVNTLVPNLHTDFIDELQKDFTYKNGKVVSKKYNKIVKDVTTKVELKSEISEDPVTNEKTTVIKAYPIVTTKHVDNTADVAIPEKGVEVSSATQLLVVYNAQLSTSFNNELTNEGKEAWATYQKDNPTWIKTPMQEFSMFLQEGIVDDGEASNKYLKPDFDMERILENFLQGAGKEFFDAAQQIPQEEGESTEDYNKRVKEESERIRKQFLDSLIDISQPLFDMSLQFQKRDK
tara:strand:+ start:571 stop:2049 length:1479 start_codon:yes stop_codon:yes gene_type:complete